MKVMLKKHMHIVGGGGGGGGGVQPHFCPWKNVSFPISSHGEKWGKKYMEREGNEYFSLSFHILFFPFFFSHGEKWENTHFSMGKNGVGPPNIVYKFTRYVSTYDPPLPAPAPPPHSNTVRIKL